MCQVGVAGSSALTFKCSSAQSKRDCRIWVDTDDKPPCEDDCSGVTRGDQTTDRARRRCREGRDERQKKEKEIWETITQPNNYSFVRIYIIFHRELQNVFKNGIILIQLCIVSFTFYRGLTSSHLCNFRFFICQEKWIFLQRVLVLRVI